jgi:hypothetical protein
VRFDVVRFDAVRFYAVEATLCMEALVPSYFKTSTNTTICCDHSI